MGKEKCLRYALRLPPYSWVQLSARRPQRSVLDDVVAFVPQKFSSFDLPHSSQKVAGILTRHYQKIGKEGSVLWKNMTLYQKCHLKTATQITQALVEWLDRCILNHRRFAGYLQGLGLFRVSNRSPFRRRLFRPERLLLPKWPQKATICSLFISKDRKQEACKNTTHQPTVSFKRQRWKFCGKSQSRIRAPKGRPPKKNQFHPFRCTDAQKDIWSIHNAYGWGRTIAGRIRRDCHRSTIDIYRIKRDGMVDTSLE